MIDVGDITVGMELRAGVGEPRTVRVCAAPYQVDGRWKVPVEYRTGCRDDVPLSLLQRRLKPPSARRNPTLDELGRELVRAGLTTSVSFDEAVRRAGLK